MNRFEELSPGALYCPSGAPEGAQRAVSLALEGWRGWSLLGAAARVEAAQRLGPAATEAPAPRPVFDPVVVAALDDEGAGWTLGAQALALRAASEGHALILWAPDEAWGALSAWAAGAEAAGYPAGALVLLCGPRALLGALQRAPALQALALAQLGALHDAELAAEVAQAASVVQSPLGLRRPPGGRLPQSSTWLERFYDGERAPREKKPGVFDHRRSAGPWFVSVDEAPLSVLDGMSQTATVVGGFREDEVAAAWHAGAFGATPLQSADLGAGPEPAAEAFAHTLRRLAPGFAQVAFAGSGAEANEKALALCRLLAPTLGPRVLAFEGAFHGRTLLSLHATANPAKRVPFQFEGYEATFAPFPVWERPGDEPEAPAGLLAAVSGGQLYEWRAGASALDPLLEAELDALAAVDAALATGDHFACIIEPMQSEGGDRYATARFYRALRLLTRRHGVPLIFDEVQTGFGLGGDFLWHQRFALVDAEGRPDLPDAVTIAKRAQVGVVLSNVVDPEPTAAHPASLVRGRLHAEAMAEDRYAPRLQALVQPRLEAVAARFPALVSRPRCAGYALAFDLPSPAELGAYLAQRFWRGVIVFGAGDRTVRYRLSTSWGPRELDRLFESIEASLAWIEAHPGEKPPAWSDLEVRQAPGPARSVRVATADEAGALIDRIVELEARAYEPARRDPREKILAALEDPDSVVVVCEGEGGALLGVAVGQALETTPDAPGVSEDPRYGQRDTLYTSSLTVDPALQGGGLGRQLKAAQLAEAAQRVGPGGAPRYRYLAGRNRVGRADAMIHLNRVFGAYGLKVLKGQYGEPDGEALYYHLPVGAQAPALPPASGGLDLSQGVARPFATPPEALRRAYEGGLLEGPAQNKITLCNYITPGVVRAAELLSRLSPGLPHLFLTSGRDELVDKALRVLRWHRPGAQVPLGLVGGYLGHTTAAARSLSDPSVHAQGPAHFSWPLLPHPAEAGWEAFEAGLRRQVEAAGGPEGVLGLFVEALQERRGWALSPAHWEGLARLRDELKIPVVVTETATAGYRGGEAAFASLAAGFTPELLSWWGGGQTGYLHTSPAYFVPNPLTMVSTWDGDELSMLRDYFHLRAAGALELGPARAALETAVGALEARGLPVRGQGLYYVVEAGAQGPALAAQLRDRGLTLRTFPGGTLAIAPALDQAAEAAERLASALQEI